MTLEVNYIAQLKDKKTGKVIAEQVVGSKKIKFPKSFKEFGLRHEEQIKLIKSSQDFFLKYQCQMLNESSTCPRCGEKTRKQGVFESDFHDIFTDHQINIQRISCRCGWQSEYTINGLYGSSVHPELAKLQAATAANHSFNKSCAILNGFSCHERKINNRSTFTRMITKVGDALNEYKKSDAWPSGAVSVNELVVATDGGHVQYKDIEKPSFEEMISTVFRPEDLITKNDGTRVLQKKLSVASAKKDSQQCIKKLTQNACKKLGMTQSTHVTALTDGASNCWSIINSLSAYAKTVTKVLDWFHIGKNFKECESEIPDHLRVLYNKAKWHLWHGHPDTGIIRLNHVLDKLSDQTSINKLKALIKYILNNREHIINYHARKIKKLPYTSQLAKSSVNTLINDRQKNKKMQWSRSGAHNILQIRTSLFSKTWDTDWEKVEETLYKKAA